MKKASDSRSKVVLRTTRAGDGPALLKLRLCALKDHPTAFGSSYEETLKHTVEDWTARAERGEGKADQAIYVGERGGELVGMTGILRGTNLKGAHAAFIWGVYVTPEFRGRGLGGRLVNACVEWARERGVHVVRLSAVTDNAASIQCYMRCGFVAHGVEPASLLWEGKYYDELLMHRWLVERAAQ